MLPLILLLVAKYVGYREMRCSMSLVSCSWLRSISSTLAKSWQFFPCLNGVEKSCRSFHLPFEMTELAVTRKFGGNVASVVETEDKKILIYYWNRNGELVKQAQILMKDEIREGITSFDDSILPMVSCKNKQLTVFKQEKEVQGCFAWRAIAKWEVQDLDSDIASVGVFHDKSSILNPTCSILYVFVASLKSLSFFTLHGERVSCWEYKPDFIPTTHVRVIVVDNLAYILTPHLLRVHTLHGNLRHSLSALTNQFWTHFRVYSNMIIIYDHNKKLLFGIDRLRFFGKHIFEIQTKEFVFICPSGRYLFLAPNNFNSVQVYTFTKE